MLTLNSVTKIYLHAAPVNLHFAFDRLAGIVRDEMGQDPLSGHLFVFRNRRGDRVKLLFWDEDGWAIFYKDLEQQDPHFFPFTGFCESPNNLGRRLNVVGGMDASSEKPGPRR